MAKSQALHYSESYDKGRFSLSKEAYRVNDPCHPIEETGRRFVHGIAVVATRNASKRNPQSLCDACPSFPQGQYPTMMAAARRTAPGQPGAEQVVLLQYFSCKS